MDREEEGEKEDVETEEDDAGSWLICLAVCVSCKWLSEVNEE